MQLVFQWVLDLSGKFFSNHLAHSPQRHQVAIIRIVSGVEIDRVVRYLDKQLEIQSAVDVHSK